MSLLEEAATLVETKNRNYLIISQMEKTKKNETDKVLLITRYNPNFHDLRHIVYDNWDMLGKSPATEFLYEKRLMCAYRRPKNLRDMIVRANTPYKQGDEKSRPDWDPDKVYNKAGREIEKEPETDTNAVSLENKEKPKTRQRSILDFLAPVLQKVAIPEPDPTPPQGTSSHKVGGTRATVTGIEQSKSQMTLKKTRGFNFCNIFNCRYCKLINKTGTINSSVTKKEFGTMKNISCRSSNLVYAITCKKCGKQYVGQTSLRLKGRFVHHFYHVEKPDKTKPVGKHFSQLDHQGIDDMDIYVLEFISKPPKSLAAAAIRDRVEKRWIHLLRSTAPGGLNLDD
jgi:hypothetical protein